MQAYTDPTGEPIQMILQFSERAYFNLMPFITYFDADEIPEIQTIIEHWVLE